MSKSLDRITLLETFVRIAEAGSISAAARDLGMSQPSASRQLADLERRLKAQLVRRNTHSLALTAAGLELLADARQLLNSWEVLADKHLSSESDLRGNLKIVAPVALGQSYLVQIASMFLAEFPRVRISWLLDDGDIRFAELGCDCWIKVGAIEDDTLIVRPLGTVQRLLVASADFVARHAMPATPRRVETLPIVALDPYEGRRLRLSKGSKEILVNPEATLTTNNIFAVKKAVSSGLGMAVLPQWFIAEELRQGELVDLLPGWRAPELDICVAYAPGQHRPRRLEAFLCHLVTGMTEIDGISPA